MRPIHAAQRQARAIEEGCSSRHSSHFHLETFHPPPPLTQFVPRERKDLVDGTQRGRLKGRETNTWNTLAVKEAPESSIRIQNETVLAGPRSCPETRSVYSSRKVHAWYTQYTSFPPHTRPFEPLPHQKGRGPKPVTRDPAPPATTKRKREPPLTARLLRARGSSESDRRSLSLRLGLLWASFPFESTGTTVETEVMGRIGRTTVFVVCWYSSRSEGVRRGEPEIVGACIEGTTRGVQRRQRTYLEAGNARVWTADIRARNGGTQLGAAGSGSASTHASQKAAYHTEHHEQGKTEIICFLWRNESPHAPS